MTHPGRASASLPIVPHATSHQPLEPSEPRAALSETAAGLALIATEPDVLTLTGLTVQANHGVFDFERRDGQPFVIDLTVWLDSSGATTADDLRQTLHYGELAIELTEAVAAEPVDLI